MMQQAGPVEEAGKAASVFMTVMKDQPLSLALVVMNLTLLGFFFFIASKAAENRKSEFEAVLESQKEVNKLLYNCVPHQRGDFNPDPSFRVQSDESHPVELPPLPKPRPPEADQSKEAN